MSTEIRMALSVLLCEAMHPPAGYLVRVDFMSRPAGIVYVSIREEGTRKYVYYTDFSLLREDVIVLDEVRKALNAIAALPVSEVVS